MLIDSTHVLKTGSDSHYKLFSTLPASRLGVLVHFHAYPVPLRVPGRVIDNSYSLNEVYAWRVFLMLNARFRISFWNSYFAAMDLGFLMGLNQMLLKNTGGSIWFEACEPAMKSVS